MVIVFGDKEGMINDAHGLMQTRMQRGARQYIIMTMLNRIYQVMTSGAEVIKNTRQLVRVVSGFMRLRVLQIGHAKRRCSEAKIEHSAIPHLFEIQKVPCLLLQ